MKFNELESKILFCSLVLIVVCGLADLLVGV